MAGGVDPMRSLTDRQVDSRLRPKGKVEKWRDEPHHRVFRQSPNAIKCAFPEALFPLAMGREDFL